jgi:hypothetical protein
MVSSVLLLMAPNPEALAISVDVSPALAPVLSAPKSRKKGR